MPFLPQSASHRTSVDKIQSIHCPVQRTHRPLPCRTSARDVHRLPDKATWPTSRYHGAVMPSNQGGLGCHPTGKKYASGPIHTTEMPSSAWGTRFATTIIDIAALSSPLHRAKCHNKLLFSKWWFTTDCYLTHTKQFLWEVFTIIRFPVEIGVRFFFVQYIRGFVFLFCIAERWFVDSINRCKLLYAA